MSCLSRAGALRQFSTSGSLTRKIKTNELVRRLMKLEEDIKKLDLRVKALEVARENKREEDEIWDPNQLKRLTGVHSNY